MALLAILFLLFSFVFLGVGSGSSNTTDLIKPVVKCSKRLPAKAPSNQEPRRCGPPPANP
jgi:hypothetical protein